MECRTFKDSAADAFVQIGVLAVLGALVTRVLLRKYPAHRLFFQFVFFVALTGLLYRYGLAPYEIAPRRRAGLRARLHRTRQDHLVDERGLGPYRLRRACF